MNVMGVSIDPSVTLELDPASAVHQYELTGQVVDDRLELQVNWPEGTKVNLNLVGTLTGKGTVSGAGPAGSKGSVGASVEAGTVLHTIEWDPITPFGTKAKRVLRLERLSPYGPFAARLDSRNETEQVSAKSGGMLVQKIDAVSLAPGKVAFEHGAVLWSQKTSDGFTITVEPRVRGDGSSAIVTVDWMAASITD